MTDIERIKELLPKLPATLFLNGASYEFYSLCRNNIAALLDAVERLESVVEQAHKALLETGHRSNCQIVGNGCTCGATEDFKVQRTEFYRMRNDFNWSQRRASARRWH